MKDLIAIVGPTATGKTRLGIRLALQFNGEVVGADSRQVYRYMDIGTAKPTKEELNLVPHHLVSIVNPDQDFSLAEYQRLAYDTIDDIHRRGKLPLLAGGSGLYIRAVLEGWEIPRAAPDPDFRRRLEERAAAEGWEVLQAELKAIDPVAAEEIDPRNIRRLIRALEVYRHTGRPASALRKKEPPPYRCLIIGLTTQRAGLYRRTDERVDRMLAEGLIEETRRLLEMGYGFDLPAMSGIGYRQVGMYLRGELTLEQAAEQIKNETHRLVRHQYGWFRLKDSRIKWFDIMTNPEDEIAAMAGGFIQKRL